jgi:hypothetical protein
MELAPEFAVVLNDARDAVEVWSTERLPFEPKGWMLDLRSELRAALRQMRARHGAVLAAVYGSQVDTFCDVENVLVYNVGAGNFAATGAVGLRLERGYFCPAPPTGLGDAARHYACYSLAPPGQGFACWGRGTVLAQWSGVAVSPLSETTKPGLVWHALRRAALDVVPREDPLAPFGLELVVGATGHERPAPAKIVKPLVDGVIAALHAHDGSALDDVSERLHAQLPDESASDIAGLLVDESAAALGQRRLLWPRMSGVQWNPADDLCVAIEVRIEPAAQREIAGRLFEVERRE